MSNLNHFHLEKTGKEQSVEELTKQIEHLEYNLEECRKKRMHYQQLFHSAPAGYLVFDQEGRIADANQRFCSMVYVPFQDRCSYNIRDLTDKDTREELDMMIHGLLKKDQVLSIEARMLCRNSYIPVIITGNRYGQPLGRMENKASMLFAGIVTEVSELKKEQQKIREKSIHDSLTGFYNRMFYNEYLLYCDKTDDLPLSAAILDLDRLKMINDSLGHSFGDRAITTVARF